MELRKAIDLFLAEQRETTRQSYLYPLRYLRDWIGPAREVGELEGVQLVEYFQHLKKRDWAAATMQKHIKTVKTFFNWLVKLKVIKESPAAEIRGKKLPSYVDRDKAITDEELFKLLDYTRWNMRDHSFLLFLADTGCRVGGAAGLRWGDIDFNGRRAKVTEKGDKTRPVQFGEACCMTLIKWKFQQLAKKTKGDYVFSPDGHMMIAHNLSQQIRRLCEKVGIRTISAHAFRHRKGHQFADRRIAPSIAATALGHSDATITLKHYYPADWETAFKEMQDMNVPFVWEAPDVNKIIEIGKRKSG